MPRHCLSLLQQCSTTLPPLQYSVRSSPKWFGRPGFFGRCATWLSRSGIVVSMSRSRKQARLAVDSRPLCASDRSSRARLADDLGRAGGNAKRSLPELLHSLIHKGYAVITHEGTGIVGNVATVYRLTLPEWEG